MTEFQSWTSLSRALIRWVTSICALSCQHHFGFSLAWGRHRTRGCDLTQRERAAVSRVRRRSIVSDGSIRGVALDGVVHNRRKQTRPRDERDRSRSYVQDYGPGPAPPPESSGQIGPCMRMIVSCAAFLMCSGELPALEMNSLSVSS